MVDLDGLQYLFTEEIEEDGDDFIVQLPQSAMETGTLTDGTTVRVGVFDARPATGAGTPSAVESAPDEGPQPPVESGDLVKVHIESIGEQGDGVATVAGGYVVMVPDTEVGDELVVEITNATPSTGFAVPFDQRSS